MAVAAILALCAGYASPQATAKPSSTKTHAHSSKLKSTKGKSRRPKKGAWKHHGQQTIQPERAREIQEALIREKYLTGEPSGQWDARTKDAMTRYQGDHGWQTKVTPDSRALIKLGLGPNYTDNLFPKPASDAVAANGAGGTTTSKQR
jgi:Putative peptidoglycan binding domain